MAVSVEYEVIVARVDWATGKVMLTYPGVVKHGTEPYDPQMQLDNALRASDAAAERHPGDGIDYTAYRTWLRGHP